MYRRSVKRPNADITDRLMVSVIGQLRGTVRNFGNLVYEPLKKWGRDLSRGRWIVPNPGSGPGRRRVAFWIREPILETKNNNVLWGIKRMVGELLKLRIRLDKKTVRNILHDYRRKGRVKKYPGWRKLLGAQANHIYAMDWFTVDTVLGRRFYCFKVATAVRFSSGHRGIQWTVTEISVRELVRQQLIEFVDKVEGVKYLIHDGTGEFRIDYRAYGIIPIQTEYKAPNMNSIAERFIRSVRREALDWIFIFQERPLRNLLAEYIEYYNEHRPHQGINQRIPEAQRKDTAEGIRFGSGRIIRMPKVSGLYRAYELAA